ncbi:cell division protein ZipA [Pseudoalteromonas shioyasakiensis]|uniref:cell division protein ZipA n=1 Tax=Pseudoalteromonas TaxID=53246 RepID=UPI000C8CA423|nr:MULTISPECIES: cell division protein ZipA [Pseudoalteromonas]MAD04373.1 cell division protein ZipA [Pseudoalteromonas sp.]MCG9709598.1 cell division protein ZipA [Pseudoalteromonas sp. Isolate3]MCP4584636.1 cell division protein ZipA [Pseudoalteromonas sp.]MCQ8882189.1 cell division protein ZipA [Pseudoalteromonas shioyasakiensis]NIZ06319.1 cell division protein ZipA [Pseudoalteromonas sp. HF66]|tara:strand:+ start:3281 stop:4009 length:729 start_codon:yes stop_codon:yes gene_type:complete
MAEELRWALIVISVFVIGGLLIHGLWSVRKKDSPDAPSVERVEPTETTSEVQEPTKAMSQERDEPEFGDLSFSAESHDEPVVSEEVVEETEIQQEETDQEQADAQGPSDFIIVHLQMPEGLTMAGSQLLPAVNMLGFKYSEEGFFNRHLDPAGTGPVLFRLVNMYNPGTFDIDNMEQFSTAGISLFMTLPCDGDGLSAFNMLHSAAKKLADEFGATILDSNREEMTVESVREYVEKVRSFSA